VLTPSIPLVLPLLVAAILAGLRRRIGAGFAGRLALLTALAVAAAALELVNETREEAILAFRPGGTGFAFVVDTASAMLVLLSAALAAAAIAFSMRYVEEAGAPYYARLLIFLAGACGFSLTGDLITLLIFAEVMSATAWALIRYHPEEHSHLAARNYVVSDAAGAILILSGTALLWARTGAVNFAQIGRSLGASSDALVATAFALLMCGLLVKTAVAPFHFWLPGVNTAAPAPVAVLFSSVMVELGLYAVARVYWTVFSGTLAPHENDLRAILASFGAVTAMAGAALCYSQRDLKRLLAFATVSHMGIQMLGVALLTRQALAGVIIYALGHAAIVGGLFLGAGIVLYRAGTLDEIELAARHRLLPGIAVLLLAGAAGLAGAPPFGTFWGELMIGGSAHAMGHFWIDWIVFLSSAATAGAIFRFTARAFFGWGPKAHAQMSDRRAAEMARPHTPFVMAAAATVLILIGLFAGLAPGLTGSAESVAIHFQDREAYARCVLDRMAPYPPTVGDQPALPGDYTRGLGTLAIAIALAASTLRWRSVRHIAGLRSAVRVLKAAHNGVVIHSVGWVIAGAAAFSAAALLFLRTY
jgi:multicomponent Na+:H+ antiporter subunit D